MNNIEILIEINLIRLKFQISKFLIRNENFYYIEINVNWKMQLKGMKKKKVTNKYKWKENIKYILKIKKKGNIEEIERNKIDK